MALKKISSAILLLSLIIIPAFASDNTQHLQCNIKLTTDKYDKGEETQDVVWDFYINNHTKTVYDWNNELVNSDFDKKMITLIMKNTDEAKVISYIYKDTMRIKVRGSVKVTDRPQYPYYNSPAIAEGDGVCKYYDDKKNNI